MKESNNDHQDANDSLITQDNKPFNLQSTSNEIQNIFKKIRKKNQETELKRNRAYENVGSKDILITNANNLKSAKDNIDIKDLIIILINIVSFICFYFSFLKTSDFANPVHYILFPMNSSQFKLFSVSSIITAIIIVFIILKKLSGYHLLYMLCYYIFIFFLHHYKYIGTSRYDQSFVIFYEFSIVLIHSLCFLLLIYYLVKFCYYSGNISKNNSFVKLFITRWHSYEKIMRSENESILNDKNLNFIFPESKGNSIKSCIIIFSLIIFQIIIVALIKMKKNKLFSCENLDIGLNGTHILYKDNLQKQCYIKNPQGYCYMDYFKYYFDLTPINNNCSLRDPIEEKKLEGINNNINYYKAKKFAFPHTNLDSKYFLGNQQNIPHFGTLVNKDIYDLEDEKSKEKNKIEPEAILDFSEDNIYQGKFAELKINLVYNKRKKKIRKFKFFI